MQAVTQQFQDAAAASFREPEWGVLVSFEKVVNENVDFFTIGTSAIEGPDMIKSAGDDVTFFDKYVYGNYTEYLKNFSIDRKLGLYPWGTYKAMARARLDNTDKKFLPGFDPDIGDKILPSRPIKLSLGFKGESILKFTGFTERPQNTFVERDTDLKAFDVFNFIDEFTSDLDEFVDTDVDDIIEALLIEMGFSLDQFVLEQSLQKPIGFLAPRGKKAGQIFRDLCEAEQGIMFADEEGIVRFWNRQHVATNQDVKFELTYSNMENVKESNTNIINDVIVRAKPREVQANQKVWELSGAEKVSGNSTLQIFADFSDDDGPLPVTAHDTPVHVLAGGSTSKYTTNEEQDGSGANRRSDISLINETLFGETLMMEFENTSSSPVYVTTLEVFGTPAKVRTSIDERYTDQNSIDTYGRNPDNNGEPVLINNDYVQDPSTALSAGYILVNDYSEPGAALRVPHFGKPHLQIGDYGNVTIADTGEIKLMVVTGIVDVIDKQGYHQVLDLEERSLVTYFTIAESEIGGTDKIPA